MNTASFLILVSCIPLFVANSFCDKAISLKNANGYSYNRIKFLAGSLFLFPVFLAEGPSYTQTGAVICGVSCGILYCISKTIILKGYRKTSVAFMTLCHAAGMIVPCVVGHFLWSEKLNLFSFCGITLTVAAIAMLKESGASSPKRMVFSGILIGIVVFFSSGGVMIAQKVMGKYFANQSVIAYNFYSFLSAFFILCFFHDEKTLITPQNSVFLRGETIFYAAESAACLAAISVAMTDLAKSVPSVLLFPLYNGIGMILVCVCSAAVFREKMTVKKVVGIILGLCGLCLVNL